MALTETTIEDKIEIVGEFKHVQVRTARVIYDNGTEISRTKPHRRVIAPDVSAADLANESTEVQAICNAVHTSAIKTAYAAHIAAQNT